MKKLNFATTLLTALLLSMCWQYGQAQSNVVDEVIWVVGDEPILKSDVEFQRLNAELNGQKISGDPYTIIPEQLAIQKLFLHQASIDSLKVTEADVMPYVNAQMDRMINLAGSQEKLEEYRGVPIKQIRQEVIKYFIESKKIDDEKKKIIGDKKISPAEVRRYFKNMPKDSLPFIPTQVEVQILTQTPEIALKEIERVKNELQDYAKRVNSGESSFATLARLYSQDEASARQGGELGYSGRAEWVPEFANVAFSLTDPNTVSKIVQTEFGYHILQLIGRKGDKVNVRHILLKPIATDDAIKKCILRLDSIASDIRANKFTFDHAVFALSDDKDTKNNNGLMVNVSSEDESQTSRFEMKDLQQDVAKIVDKMHVGEISDGFSMINKDGKQVCAIVLLKNRINGHKADITEDFQALTDIVSNKKNEEVLEKWIKEKQKTTYISIKDGWKRTDFKYPGWIK